MSESDIAFLLTDQVQQFIHQNIHKSPTDLILASSPYSSAQMKIIAAQVQARRKAKTKLPFWFEQTKIIYPTLLSVEQCSSEITAQYKSSLLQGQALADLTGGFGVDSHYFAQKFQQVYYVEQNKTLTRLASHNFQQLNISNIKIQPQDAEEFVYQLNNSLDAIYIDPARRDHQKNKVFRLEDCTPNILQLLSLLWKKTSEILIKLSPMLDIDLGIAQLKTVAEVIVVAVNNECKELLFLLKKDWIKAPIIKSINLFAHKPAQSFGFTRQEEATSQIEYSEPLQYLYEPNAAILKSGAFRRIGEYYKLSKLHPHSHLYTSGAKIEAFPGRSFRIKAICKYAKKEIQRSLPTRKVNITTRNFPDTVATARKKLGLKEGGEAYLFLTQTQGHKTLAIITEKA